MASRKALCSRYSSIDSFEEFKNKEGIAYVRASKERVLFTMPPYDLKAILNDADISISCKQGFYTIPLETKPCNFGGFYHFFHCPACKKRMRKLYCIDGIFICRECAKLGYYSQRLRPPDRFAYACIKIKNKLKDLCGTIERKPPYMTQRAFKKLRMKYVDYDQKWCNADLKETFARFGDILDTYDPPDGMYDEYVENEDTRNFYKLFDRPIQEGTYGLSLYKHLLIKRSRRQTRNM